MKDGCYGYPSAQKKVHWVHCPQCYRCWGLTTRTTCVVCGTPLADGEPPKFRLSPEQKKVAALFAKGGKEE